MEAITIIIAALVAAAAFFAVLQDREDVRKYETRAESLSRELADLRVELARRDAESPYVPLTKDSVVDFLKKEKTDDVVVSEDGEHILFSFMGGLYHIPCSRMPHQFVLRKGWDMAGVSIRWDVLERVAAEVTKSLVMVKMNVVVNDSYDFLIITGDHTVGTLRENFDFYMSIIADGERMAREKYREIMDAEHPEEDGASMNAEEMALKMAEVAAGQNKMRS